MESIIYMLSFLALYFAPIFIAIHKKRNDIASISIINFFLGWTLIGWIICLAWAFKPQTK